MITGESLPVVKAVDDRVPGGAFDGTQPYRYRGRAGWKGNRAIADRRNGGASATQPRANPRSGRQSGELVRAGGNRDCDSHDCSCGGLSGQSRGWPMEL